MIMNTRNALLAVAFAVVAVPAFAANEAGKKQAAAVPAAPVVAEKQVNPPAPVVVAPGYLDSFKANMNFAKEATLDFTWNNHSIAYRIAIISGILLAVKGAQDVVSKVVSCVTTSDQEVDEDGRD